MVEFTAHQRNNLHPTDFAIPPKNGQPGKYPIKRQGTPDRAHAADALGRAKANGDPAELAQVRQAVCKLFPDFPECTTNVRALADRVNASKTASGGSGS